MTSPSQYALKLPATRPARMFRDAPPSREDATTSRTCDDSVEVNSLTSSGIIAPASVPHVITVESFHQSVPSPRVGIRRKEIKYVVATDTMEVSHTSTVSGASKLRVAASRYRARVTAEFSRYDAPLAITIMTRIMKIQTSSCT